MGRRDRGNDKGNGGGLIGKAVKGGGFMIGLATEVNAHNKARKASSQSNQQQLPQKDAVQDEAYHGFDGAPPAYDEAMNSKPSLRCESPMIDEKMAHVDEPLTTRPLPCPVILPQRRPNDKSRGFVRAYAPDLGTYKGIEEATFLNFLIEFHKSSQASGIFMIINIAAMGAGLAPGPIAMAVSMSVQMASKAAAETQSRCRTNTFLDKANEELFHPKNLHCMIMTFKPEVSGSAVLNSSLEKESSIGVPATLSQTMSASSNQSGMSGNMKGGSKFRVSDGVTVGEFMLPQAADLVYPASIPDEESPETDENGVPLEKKESSWKSTGKFLADYKDRRAQAKFAAQYGQGSKLAVPGATDSSKFASKWSDPNASPLESFSGLRGDQNNSRDRNRAERKEARRDRREDRRRSRDRSKGRSRDRGHSRDRLQLESRSSGDRSGRDTGRERRSRPGLIGGAKDFLMQQDILYLLIAEIPSEEEMQQLLQ